MPSDPADPVDLRWAALADQRYLLLTTFRRNGTPVPTPVWAAPDGPDLLVVTGAGAGKVARLRHTPRVLLQPCDGGGRTRPGAEPVEAVAELLTDPEPVERVRTLLAAKYGWQYRAIRLLFRLRGRTGPEAGIRIRPFTG